MNYQTLGHLTMV